MLREHELTEALLGLALEQGSPAAHQLETTSSPLTLSLLGHFEPDERKVDLETGRCCLGWYPDDAGRGRETCEISVGVASETDQPDGRLPAIVL